MQSKRRAWLTTDTSAPTDFICRRVRIPNDINLIGAVTGALLLLANEGNWEQFGAATPAQTALLFSDMLIDYLESDVCMIGTILPYATDAPPNGCLPCDGGTYNRVDYPRLYERLAAVFIIDADTFRTPAMFDRVPVGAGLSYDAGDVGGAATVELTVAEMPAHDHTSAPHSHSEITAVSSVVNGGLEAPAFVATPGVGTTGSTAAVIDSSGGGDAHENMPPFLALPFCIVAR